jgi:PKD repeat protein
MQVNVPKKYRCWLFLVLVIVLGCEIVGVASAAGGKIGLLQFSYTCPGDCVAPATVDFSYVDGSGSNGDNTWNCEKELAWRGSFSYGEGTPFFWDELAGEGLGVPGAMKKILGSPPPPLPKHTYQNPGQYTGTMVTNIFENGNCGGTFTDTITIYDPPPKAHIDTDPKQVLGIPTIFGEAPFEVKFFDVSENNPTSRVWTVYKLPSSNELVSKSTPDFTYTFHAAGQYSVMLHALKNSYGKSFDSQANVLVLVTPNKSEECKKDPPINAEFSHNIRSGTAPLNVQFTDASTGPVDKWSWDFGDNNNGPERNLQNPVHVYKDYGTFSVSLQVQHDGCPITALKKEESSVTVNAQKNMNELNYPADAGNPIPVNDISAVPCGKTGYLRCDRVCINVTADPNNCGACGHVCEKPGTCTNGQCSVRMDNVPKNNAWYDIFLSLPRTIVSLAKGNAGPDTRNAEPVPGVDLRQGSSAETQGGAMNVVVLPGQAEQRGEIIQGSGNGITIITPDLTEQPGPDTQEHMINGEGGTPTPAPYTDVQMNIPKTYPGHEPTMATFRPNTCPPGYVTCNGLCVDPMTDATYCGSCNSTCPSGSACVAGVCTLQCSSGLTSCNGACTSLLNDPDNCGACANVCTNGGTCGNGQCVLRIATTQPTQPGGIGMTRQHI